MRADLGFRTRRTGGLNEDDGGRCASERAPEDRLRDEIVRDDARSDATRGRGRLRALRAGRGGAPAKVDSCEARADIVLPGRVGWGTTGVARA